MLSRKIEIALGSKIIYAQAVLKKLGYGDAVIEQCLKDATHGSSWHLSTAIKQGKKDCKKYYKIDSWQLLKEAADNYVVAMGKAKKRETMREEVLAHLPPLSRAHKRTKRLNNEGHDFHKIIRDNKYIEKSSETFLYRDESEGPRLSLDCLIVAFEAGVETSSFWQNYAYLRFLGKCVIPLGYIHRGIGYGFDAQEIYTLYRICTHDFHCKSDDYENPLHVPLICQTYIKRIVENLFTLEIFLEKAYKICQENDMFAFSQYSGNRILTLSETAFKDRRFAII
jgi:hypothetical protein